MAAPSPVAAAFVCCIIAAARLCKSERAALSCDSYATF